MVNFRLGLEVLAPHNGAVRTPDDFGAFSLIEIVPCGDLPRAVRMAIELLERRRLSVGVMRFMAGVKLDRETARAGGDALAKCVILRELHLVHPDAKLGFFASTLSLAAPRVIVGTLDEVPVGGNATGLRLPTPLLGVPALVGQAPRHHHTILELPKGSVTDVVAYLLAHAPGKPHVALRVPAGRTLSPAMIDAVGRALGSAHQLKEVVLVQNSTAIGFVASSLSLKIPGVKVRAVRDLSEID